MWKVKLIDFIIQVRHCLMTFIFGLLNLHNHIHFFSFWIWSDVIWWAVHPGRAYPSLFIVLTNQAYSSLFTVLTNQAYLSRFIVHTNQAYLSLFIVLINQAYLSLFIVLNNQPYLSLLLAFFTTCNKYRYILISDFDLFCIHVHFYSFSEFFLIRSFPFFSFLFLSLSCFSWI